MRAGARFGAASLGASSSCSYQSLFILLIGGIVAEPPTGELAEVKQLGLAVRNYAGISDGWIPPSTTAQPVTGSLNVALLPYLEQDAIYQQCVAAGYGWVDLSLPIKTLLCPLDPTISQNALTGSGWAASDYQHKHALFSTSNVTRTSPAYRVNTIPDGSSSTVGFAEHCGNCGGLWSIRNYPPSYYSACTWWASNSGHTAGMTVGLMDGGVRSVSADVSQNTWYQACQPADGRVLGGDW